jgi:gluconate 2-dehydrogenase gamma chain
MSESTGDLSRRDALRQLGIGVTATVSLEAAQHAHETVALQKTAAKGEYAPKYLTAHEYQTLRRLADIIMPGSLDAGAPEFIDYLSSQNKEMGEIYTGGIFWIDTEMKRRHGAAFVDAKPAEQTALLDLIAYRRNSTPELAPGIHFFAWMRNMVVDAYYTSPVGVKDIGYMGNTASSEFSVPAEALAYALKRSPFA